MPINKKGDTHTDVYMQDGRYLGRNHPQHGRKCLIAGEHNESDNCFFTIRAGGNVFYHCFDDEAHDRNSSVCIGEINDHKNEELKKFVNDLPSTDLRILKTVLPATCHDLKISQMDCNDFKKNKKFKLPNCRFYYFYRS